MKLDNEIGAISMAPAVFTTISGVAATNCFGVKGMAMRTVGDGLVHLLRRENISQGVKVALTPGNEVRVALHIIVEHGVNIPAVCDSIMAEVRYHLERLTSLPVRSVDVFVDGIVREKRA